MKKDVTITIKSFGKKKCKNCGWLDNGFTIPHCVLFYVSLKVDPSDNSTDYDNAYRCVQCLEIERMWREGRA